MLTILALDPGVSNLGWALVVFDGIQWAVKDCGCIHAAPARKGHLVAGERLRRSRFAFGELLRLARENEIHGLVAELPSGGSKSAKACAAMAEATSLVAALAETFLMPTKFILPSGTRKQLFPGKKIVSKKEIANYVKKWFLTPITVTGLMKNDEHIYEALGAFIASVTSDEIRGLLEAEVNGQLKAPSNLADLVVTQGTGYTGEVQVLEGDLPNEN